MKDNKQRTAWCCNGETPEIISTMLHHFIQSTTSHVLGSKCKWAQVDVTHWQSEQGSNRRGASSPRKILSALRSLLVTSETTFTNFAFSAAEDPAVKLFKVHLVARQMGPYHWSGCLKSNTRSPRTMHACIVMSHTTIPSYGCFRLELWWNLSSADLLVWLQMYILFLSCKKKCRQKDCKTRSSSR